MASIDLDFLESLDSVPSAFNDVTPKFIANSALCNLEPYFKDARSNVLSFILDLILIICLSDSSSFSIFLSTGILKSSFSITEAIRSLFFSSLILFLI